MKKIFLQMKSEAGFTLIEVLLGMIVLSVMVGTMSLTLSQNYQEKTHTEQLIKNSQQLRSVESSITDELRYATAGSGFTTNSTSINYSDLNNQPCEITWNNGTKKVIITNTSTNVIKATLDTPNIDQLEFQKDTTDTTNRTVIITIDTLDCRSNSISQNISKIRMLN